MALADELNKRSSERYTLVKITPTLRVTDIVYIKSAWIYATLAGELPAGLEIAAVRVDGVAYTESATVNPSVGSYYYNFSTAVFEISLASPLSNKEIVIFFVLRFTDSAHSIFDENGVKSAIGASYWQPRLEAAPVINASVRDMMQGVASISSSTINISNTDLWLNSFVGEDFSYLNKAVDVTLCINEQVFCRFSGRTKGIKPSADSYSFNIYDNLYSLNEPCLMGDTNADVYINATDYPDVDQSKIGKPIPYFIGKTAHKSAVILNPSARKIYSFDESSTLEAYCTDTTDSLTWVFARQSGDGDGLKVIDYGTPSLITFNGAYYDYAGGSLNRSVINVNQTVGIPHNIELLDTVVFKKAGTSYPGTVVRIEDGAGNYDVMLWDAAATAGTYTVTTTPEVSIGVMIIQDGVKYLPTGGWNGGAGKGDYYVTSTALDSGNLLWEIVFKSGFESNHEAMLPLDFSKDRVFVRATEDTATNDTTTHGKAVEKILSSAGLTVSSASITAADSDLAANVSLMIPEFSSSSPRSYLNYLGLIMQSTLGYIYQDNSTLEINYKIFEEPAAGDFLHGSDILDLSVEIQTDDMAQSIRSYNDNNFYTAQAFSHPLPATISTQVSSGRSRYHHLLTNQASVESALSLPVTTCNRRMAMAENPQLFVSFSVATKLANKNIGDDISIYDDRIPGEKSSVSGFLCSNLKIVGIEYSAEKITFTATNLRMT